MKQLSYFSEKVLLAVILFLFVSSTFAQTKPTLYPKLESGKYGYYNASQTLIITSQFENALGFNGGLAAVKKAGKWGYINESGNLVISYIYDKAWYFTEGLAAVAKSNKWGYINKEGKTVINFIYDDAGDFSDGIAWVKTSGGVTFINLQGKTIINTPYESATSFSETLAGVKKDKLWGYINKDGTEKIKFQFDDAMPFADGLAAVKQGSYWGFIDIYGKTMVNFTYSVLKDKYPDAAFAWSYASNAYTISSPFYLSHLKKAVTLIRSEVYYYSATDLKLMLKYYEALKDNDGISWVKSEIKKQKKTNRSPAVSVDFSVATEPFKLMLYTVFKEVPVYAELRMGYFGVAARYDTYKNHIERYKFGRYLATNTQDTLMYSGSDQSLFALFYFKQYMKKGYKGYGYSGLSIGFEYRNSSYDLNPVRVNLRNPNNATSNNEAISPHFGVQDVTFNYNYTYSLKFIYFSMGGGLGVGFRTFTGLDNNKYVLENTVLDKSKLTKVYMPLRFYLRFGINLF